MKNAKNAVPVWILAWALCFCATATLGQNIEDTVHDFSSFGWTPEGYLCTPCHSVYAEWNHDLSNQTYTISNSPTLDSVDFGQPDGKSARCLGCHDGTVPVDSFAGRNGSTFIAPAAQLGPDLSSHHPVSFTYDSTLAAIDGGLHDPATRASGLGGTIAQKLLERDGKLQCTACHDLHTDRGNEKFLVKPTEGGTLCVTCHRVGDGPPNDHTEVRMGFANHKPGLGNPADNGCVLCHGPNLDDGFAPSCYTCHDRIWAGEGPPDNHTELRMGFADHRPGLGNPFENGCTQCHGPNLNDGFAPSCYTCHNRIWAGEGPPDNHTELRMGFADHRPGLGNPIDNGCTQCHGPNLNDGFAPSCFTCHLELWDGQNRPPSVDTGGPYSGSVGHSVGLDASATADPDGDSLTFLWDFGDGSPVESSGGNPATIHTYDTVGTYTGTLSVDDGVNAPVLVDFQVEMSDEPPGPQGDAWLVNVPLLSTDFAVTFEDVDGFLLTKTVHADGRISFGIGIEMDGIIFWMDLPGSLFFGNINRDAGTMVGIMFGSDGSGSIWFGEQR